MITEIAYGVIGVISLLVILLNIYGSRIQENHSITVSHEFPVPTATIYHNITDIEGQVAWWSELKVWLSITFSLLFIRCRRRLVGFEY
jgi:hypothetical protein